MEYVDTPLAAQKLSVSQPLIRNNFLTATTIFNKDHYGFNNTSSNAGLHQKITFPAIVATTPPAVNTGAINIGAGSALPAATNLLFYNSSSAAQGYVLNAIRAFGSFQGRTTNGACTINNSSGLTAARVSQGGYNVTIAAGLVNTANYLVLVSCQINNGATVGAKSGYFITSATAFRLNFQELNSASTTDPGYFSVAVIQV